MKVFININVNKENNVVTWSGPNFDKECGILHYLKHANSNDANVGCNLLVGML